ncbi:MAG: bifunctional metallophosphatase/5'-nucleotidase [Actinomycetes bacterium]
MTLITTGMPAIAWPSGRRPSPEARPGTHTGAATSARSGTSSNAPEGGEDLGAEQSDSHEDEAGSVAVPDPASSPVVEAVSYAEDVAQRARGGEAEIQLLALNDLHGHLTAPQGSKGEVEVGSEDHPRSVQAGGMEYLTSHLERLRQGHPNSLTVAAGDLIGASPMLSGSFHDEPTVAALRRAELDVAGVGNHEFDEGVGEVQRLFYGGCHPVDGCYSQRVYPGSGFPFLAANVTRKDSGGWVLPPTWVREVDGVKLGFIGITLEGTREVTAARRVTDLDFADEVRTAAAVVPSLRRQGVRSIVLLLHEGGFQTGGANDCSGASGPVFDIARRLPPEIDVVVTGHTHEAYLCRLPDPHGDERLVTSASSYGRVITDIRLVVDRRTGEVRRGASTARNVVVSHDVPRDAGTTDLIATWRGRLGADAVKTLGRLAGPVTDSRDPSKESPLGSVVADAYLAAGRRDGAQIALTNPLGFRGDLVGGPGGKVGYEHVHDVLPFHNRLVTMTMTGRQIRAVLRQQFVNHSGGKRPMLQVSRGFGYAWRPWAPPEHELVPDSVSLYGRSLGRTTRYRVVTTRPLAEGHGGSTAFRRGTARVDGAVLADALAMHLDRRSPLHPPLTDRIDIRPRPRPKARHHTHRTSHRRSWR